MDYGSPPYTMPDRAAVIHVAATVHRCPPESFASRAYLPRRLLISVQLAQKAGERPKAACVYTGNRHMALKIGDRCSLSRVTSHTDAFDQGVAIDICAETQDVTPSCAVTCETD